MKRRIIAALTALVMVVTMIPSSAFAAGTSSISNAADVNAVIETAIGDGTVVYYESKSLVNDAFVAYTGFSDAEKGKVNNEDKLKAAVNAFATFDKKVEDYKALASKLMPGIFTSKDGKNLDQELGNDVMKVYSTFVNGYCYGQSGAEKIKVAKLTKEEIIAEIGEANYSISSAMLTDTSANVPKLVKAVNDMDAFTDKEIAEAELPLTGTIATVYNRVDANLRTTCKSGMSYIHLAKGYDKFLALDARVKAYNDVATDVAELTKEISGTVSGTAKSVKEISLLDSKQMKDFTTALSEAKTLVAEKEVPKSFADLYKAAQKNYDKYLTKDSVAAEIMKLPKPADIAKFDDMQVLETYNAVIAIDPEVAAVTTVGSVYNDVVKAVNARMSTFKVDTIAKKYAEKLYTAVKEIPAVPTRGDIDKVDAALKIVIEYKDLTTAAGKSTGAEKVAFAAEAAKITAAKANLLGEADDVFELADVTSVSATFVAADSKLATYLNEYDKKAVEKIANASAYIVKIAGENEKTITDLAAIVSTSTGAVPTTILNGDGDVVDEDVAKKAVADFEAGYAALGNLKADFDKAAADKSKPQFYNVNENLKDIKEALDEISDINDEFIANRVIINMTAFVTAYDKEAVKVGNEAYNNAVATINSFEADMANPAVKKLVEAAPVYKTYKEIKDYIDSLTADTTLPKAVIDAIDALKVIDVTKDVVTKELTDNTIASYESVMKSYDALSAADKAKVTNYSKMATVKGVVDGTKGIIPAIQKVFVDEVAKIGTFDSGNKIPFTSEQKSIVNGLTAMIDQYKDYVTVDNLNKSVTTKTAYSTYTTALTKLNNEIKDEGEKEFTAIESYLSNVKTKYYVAGNYKVDKNSATAIVEAVDKYNALSEVAKKWATGNKKDSAYEIGKLLASYNFAKALILDYAIVTVEDQEYTGSALTPVVTVKDINGNVISDKEYVVTYTDNVNPGVAKVIVTAEANGNYVGTVTKEFKITIDTPVKADITKVDTDYGIVRVYFDRNEEVNGDAVKFQVQYKKTTSDKWIVKYPTAGYDYLTLRNLTKNGKYDVRVRAYFVVDGEKVYGEYSDVKEVYANRNGAQSGTMYKAVINKLSTKNGSVTVTVKGVKYQTVPQGVTWKYSFKKYGSQYTTWSTAKTTKSTSYTFKNLKKGTRYVFRAQYTYNTAVDGKTAVNSNYSVYKNIVVK